MRELNKYVMWLSFVALIVSFWNRNAFPDNMALVSEIHAEPQQAAVNLKPFAVALNGVDYVVNPLFEYELYGLVVSYRHHDGDSQLHERWNDHLNMMDLCVIWSDTALSQHLNDLDFWSGQFTCNVKTDSDEAWNNFNMSQLSNNHLLSIDPIMRDRVQDVSIGDQIHLKGWLASYSSAGGQNRGTSTTRDDTGNGACETIYLQDFNIIRSVSGHWRDLMYVALLLLLITVANHLRMPYQPNPNRR